MKIRLTKELPWASVGLEFQVFDDGYIVIDTGLKGNHYRFPVKDLEGWYEVVRWKPAVNESFFCIEVGMNGFFIKSVEYQKESLCSNVLFIENNCFQTKVDAEQSLKKIREALSLKYPLHSRTA